MIGLVPLFLFACSNPDETYTTAPGLHADVPARELLSEWRAWLTLSRGELERRLTVSESTLRRAVSDEGKEGLDLIHVPSYCPAVFYLDGEQIVLIHNSNDEALTSFKPAELAAWFPPEARLRSNAGNTYSHYVDASSGIAWSATSDEVAILELFHPTTVEQYKARFYTEPMPFIK